MSHRVPPEDIQYQQQHIDDNRASDLITTFATCTALAYLAVVLRLIARRLNKTTLQADDFWVLIALILLTGQMIVGLMGVSIGAGKHVVLLQHPSKFAKIVLSLQVLYVACTAAAKFSILLLYGRLFGLYNKFRVALYVVGAITFCYSLVSILVIIFQCRPVNAAWNFNIKGECVNLVLGGIIVGSVNVAVDFVILFLPMPLVWSLDVQTKWKVQLACIFLLGGFVCIGSIYRVTVLDGLASRDPTWELVDAAIWAFVENAIGIVSACLPTLRPIYNLLVHGHHCSVRDNCSRCLTSTQPKTSDYVTASREQDSPETRPYPPFPRTQMRAIQPYMPPAAYATPPTTYTTPNGSSDVASSDHASQTFWISGTTESDPESWTRETPSIEIW